MANKVHFVCTQTELGEGPVKAVCGKVIEKPQKVFMWDEMSMVMPLPYLPVRGGCPDCWFVIRGLPDGIVYGVRERPCE